MRTREIQCIHYVREGECNLGHEGTFRSCCQHCKQYKKMAGARPARTDTRRAKNERRIRKEKIEY